MTRKKHLNTCFLSQKSLGLKQSHKIKMGIVTDYSDKVSRSLLLICESSTVFSEITLFGHIFKVKGQNKFKVIRYKWEWSMTILTKFGINLMYYVEVLRI